MSAAGRELAAEPERVAVSVATTRGPVRILRIREENPAVRSVICLDGTFSALPISRDYDAFVRAPTGVIERETGHPAYRVDVDGPIESGDSWHLGVYLAHMLARAGRLAEKGEAVAVKLLVTGSLDRSLSVGAVSHVKEKFERAGRPDGDDVGAGARSEFIFPADGVAPSALPGWTLRPVATAAEALAVYSGRSGPGAARRGASCRTAVALSLLVGAALVFGGAFLWFGPSGEMPEARERVSAELVPSAGTDGSIIQVSIVPRDPVTGRCGMAIRLEADAEHFDGEACGGRVETREAGEFLIRMSAQGGFSAYVDDRRYHRELLRTADGGDSVNLSLEFPYWVREEFFFVTEANMLFLDGTPTRTAKRRVLIRPERMVGSRNVDKSKQAVD